MSIAIMAVVALVIAGAPALATTGQPGPTPPAVSDPVSSVAEVQAWEINPAPAASGSYTLIVNGANASMARNERDVSAESIIEAALVAAYGGTNDVTVIAARSVSYRVTFNLVGSNVGVNVPQMTLGANTLGGLLAPYAVTVTTVQEGNGAVVTQESPHNGYSSLTNYCVQCHAVHAYQTGPTTFQGGNGYALLQGTSVTATCNTCHALFGTAATGRVNSNAITGKPPTGSPGLGMGTTSLRSAYDSATGTGPLPSGISGHALGTNTSPLPDNVTMNQVGWTYGSFSAAPWFADVEAAGGGTATANDGGLYCGSCHTPHGEFGQLINSAAAGGSGTVGSGNAVPNTSGNPGYRQNAFNVQNLNAVQFIDARELAAGEFYRLRVFDPALGFAVDDPAGYVTITSDVTDTTTAAQLDGYLDAALGGAQVAVVYAQSTAGSTSTAIGAATWATRFYRVTFNGANVDAFTMPQIEPVDGSIPASPLNVPEKVEVITSVGGGAIGTYSAPSTPATLTGNSATGNINVGATAWAEGNPIFQYKGSGASPTVYYLHLDSSPAAGAGPVWEKCDQTATGAAPTITAVANGIDTVPSPGTCSFLTTTDSEGQTVSLYGYKLLTAYPNHDYLKPESWGVASRGTDQARWCGACHPSKVSPDFGVEGEYAVDVAGVPTTFHSHPTACSYCHGVPADATAASSDFPHTSTNGALLKAYPDALCVGCHGPGTLP